jgi:hypothetical protein
MCLHPMKLNLRSSVSEAPPVVWRGSFEQGSRTGPPKASLTYFFPILAGGSRSRGAQTGPCPLTMAHLLALTAQPGSPTAQAIAATAQVQRRKWKLLMSRFRYRTACSSTVRSKICCCAFLLYITPFFLDMLPTP